MEGKEKRICCKCQWPRLAGNTSDHLNYGIHLPREWSLLSIYLISIRQIKLYQTVFMKDKKTENCPRPFDVERARR